MIKLKTYFQHTSQDAAHNKIFNELQKLINESKDSKEINDLDQIPN
jgi:hypothetical protein